MFRPLSYICGDICLRVYVYVYVYTYVSRKSSDLKLEFRITYCKYDIEYTVLLNSCEIQILTSMLHMCSLLNYGFVNVVDTCVFCIVLFLLIKLCSRTVMVIKVWTWYLLLTCIMCAPAVPSEIMGAVYAYKDLSLIVFCYAVYFRLLYWFRHLVRCEYYIWHSSTRCFICIILS